MKLWFIHFVFACCMSDTFALTSIETIPPTTSDTLVTRYSGLVVKAIFPKTMSTTNCGWRYNGETTANGKFGNLVFLVSGYECVPREDKKQTITCMKRMIDGVNHIITNLTYLESLTSDLVLAVRCNGGEDLIIALPTKRVRDCIPTLPNSVYVDTTSNSYESEGTFRCPGSAVVLYSNGSQPTTLQTSCLYTAEWKGQEDLVCWEAPEPQLIGHVTVLEGKNVDLRCEYEDVVPVGESSIFYFNGAGCTINKNQNFTITSLQAVDNTKQVSCQAVTPYTQIYNESGRSPSININVLYAPFNSTPANCTWVVNNIGICTITFSTNPKSVLLNITKNNLAVGNTTSNTIVTLISGSNDKQMLTYRRTKVNKNDGGTYNVHLVSPVSPYNHTITFTIIVTNSTSSSNHSTTRASVAASVSTMLFLVLFIAILLWRYKPLKKKLKMKDFSLKMKKKVHHFVFEQETEHVEDIYTAMNKETKKDKEEVKAVSSTLHTTTHNNTQTEQEYAIVVKKTKTKTVTSSTAKEEKVNPINATSTQPIDVESAYGVVHKNRKKKLKPSAGKEEKTNNLYALRSAQANIIEPAYGVVNKTKKKSKRMRKHSHGQVISSSSKEYVEEDYGQENTKRSNTGMKTSTSGPDAVYTDTLSSVISK